MVSYYVYIIVVSFSAALPNLKLDYDAIVSPSLTVCCAIRQTLSIRTLSAARNLRIYIMRLKPY